MARPKGTKAGPKAKLPAPKVSDDSNQQEHSALKLAGDGYSYAEIAGELGVTKEKAVQLVHNEIADRVRLNKMGEKILGKDATVIERERILLNTYIEQIKRNAADGIVRGSPAAMAVGLKAAELQAKLNGWFPSEKHEHTLNEGDPAKAKQLWKDLFGGAPIDTTPDESGQPKPN